MESLAEEDPQGRVVGLDDLEECLGRGGRVATRQGGLDEVAAEAAGRTGDESDLAHDVLPFSLR
ncbi:MULTISPECIES: hypothetical protein [Streptosporangium]|uniref:Uncharacterized protein n=1 Tax=Streptosporangium brasiliense TaxID=47480 RepID=A0ABT9R735_9ACTN|nr:hypothetical protein [Streptosporangium brasiliense]MDP9864953.1 hypothetical protein [Streptosporangium brasiliense]